MCLCAFVLDCINRVNAKFAVETSAATQRHGRCTPYNTAFRTKPRTTQSAVRIPHFFLCLCAFMPLCLFYSLTYPQEAVVGREKNSCALCHREEKTRLNESVHSRFNVTCVDCHGGNPTELERQKAMSKRAGYRGRITHSEIPLVCNRCHGDYGMMRQFGIPNDQLESYKTSVHGQKLFNANDQNVAQCVSCHGSHDIKSVKDPTSMVYPLNIPSTCAKCHSNKQLMSKYSLNGDEYEQYSKGIHGIKLLEYKDLNVPTCTTCHGNHGAAPPGVSEVANMCGKCHINTRDYFVKSIHYKKGVECANCHENHNIQSLKVANDFNLNKMMLRYDEICIKCHTEKDQKYTKFSNHLKRLIKQTQQKLNTAEKLLKKGVSTGIYVDKEMILSQEAKTHLTEFAVIQHSLSIYDIDEILRQTGSNAQHITENIDDKFVVLKDRKIYLGVVTLFLLFFLLIVYMKFNRLKSTYLKDKQGTNLR